MYFQTDINKPLNKWFSVTGRLMPTFIQERTDLGNRFSFLEKSNGANLDLDYNLHLRFFGFDFFPSAGVSTRIADNQHIRMSSVMSGPQGVVEAHATYHKEVSVNAGWTIGLNLQVPLHKSLLIGGRLAGMNYGEYQYWSVGATLRFVRN